eukprot:5134750-Heterocapsa_arctica.AAC.1
MQRLAADFEVPEVRPGPRGDREDPGGGSRAPAHGRRAAVCADVVQDESAHDEQLDGYASMGLGKRDSEG